MKINTPFTLLSFSLFALRGFSQTVSTAPLPPAAQEAVNKGIVAAKLPDYPLAIRCFEEARGLAPQSPAIFFYLGLAESKIPGRELRAICWFEADLAVNPTASNASAIKEEIDALDIKSQSNTSSMIRSLQDMAMQLHNLNPSNNNVFDDLIWCWEMAGDYTTARKTIDLIPNGYGKCYQLTTLASFQEGAGDMAGAKKTLSASLRTIDQIQDAYKKDLALDFIADTQLSAGDTEGAVKTAGQIQNKDSKITTLCEFANDQFKAGDISGAKQTLASAQKTLDLIQDEGWKGAEQYSIAKAQANMKDVADALATVDLIQDAGWKNKTLCAIAEAQALGGDVAGAFKTVDLIQDAGWKSNAQMDIVKAQANAGDIAGAQKTADLLQDAGPDQLWKTTALQAISNAQTQTLPAPAPDWLYMLDNSNKDSFCPLNTDLFLDLAGYLKSLPPSGDAKKAYDLFSTTTQKIVQTQHMIDTILKKQSGK